MADKSLHGSLKVPGDKSISHRALIFSALSKGKSTVRGLSPAEDCASTARCLSQLGLKIEFLDRAGASQINAASGAETIAVGTSRSDANGSSRSSVDSALDSATSGKAAVTGKSNIVSITSPGPFALLPPQAVLDAGNSGTTMRIMSGLVAGQDFTTRFDGDSSLRRRPMGRVLNLLEQMGAGIDYDQPGNQEKSGRAPFSIKGGSLQGQTFKLSQASAQVQTALILAGLQAQGATTIELPAVVRDHTQRMLRYIGVPFEEHPDNSLTVKKLSEPALPFVIDVPADISSAAFFLVGAALLPGSELVLKDVSVNLGRRLVIDVLARMGADITVINERESCGEPIADILIRYAGRLTGTTISGAEIAQGIDEIPILSIAGALCRGTFTVEGAGELKHKESNRLAAITGNLKAAGAAVEETSDGLTIEGQESLAGGSLWQTFEDHRLAMTGLIAQFIFKNPITVSECESIKISYPSFQSDLIALTENS